MPLRLFGAILALTIIAAVAVALTLTAGPTQAQNATNTYDDPQPCGPGAGTAFQPEPHEVHEGHFALFDTYWQPGSDEPNTGKLRTNLCPPMVTETENDEEETVATLTASGIDIDEAIFHVLDDDKVTVVSGTAGDGQISTGDFARLAQLDHVEVGDPVWWLRLDGTSDLTLGFSTKRFSDTYWASTEPDTSAFRYMLELERTPGLSPQDHPHFIAYKKPQTDNAPAELVWDSNEPHVTALEMQPGQLEDLQWIFTTPGTYEIWVHLLGHVRHPENPPADWEPISGNITETSEVKRYVIQVGSELEEVEPPQFGVNYSIPENSPAPTPLGPPIPIFRTELDDLSYQLSGEGSDDFAVVSTTNPNTVQVVVADGAQLDFETRAKYELTLEVTDNLDHESNQDDTIDDTLALGITLEDVPPSAVIKASTHNPELGQGVTFAGVVKEFGEPGHIVYIFSGGSDGIFSSTTSNTYSSHSAIPTTQTIHFTAEYLPPGGDPATDTQRITAEPVTVTWR